MSMRGIQENISRMQEQNLEYEMKEFRILTENSGRQNNNCGYTKNIFWYTEKNKKQYTRRN